MTPRGFTEVAALYGPEMTPVWSGGVVYEWTQENNRYGLVQMQPSGDVEIMEDYTNLMNQMAKTNPKGVKMDEYNEERAPPDCPPMTKNWKASTVLPPTPSDGACECMVENLECVASDQVVSTVGQTGNSTLGVQLDTMCGIVSCGEIVSDGEKGTYGAYSFCSPRDKLSWLYNLKAKELKTSTSCGYNGFGQEVTPRRFDLQTCATIPPVLDKPADDSNGPAQSSSTNISGSGNAFVASIVCVVAATFFM